MADDRRPSVTRRRFLTVSSALVVGASLGPGCASRRTVVRGACHHDCPDGCSWLTTIEDGRVVRFEGDPNHPFTRGRLCARVSGYPDDVVMSPDRLLHPLRRTGKKGEGRFDRVTWDEALGEVADRLQKVIAEHGPAAVLPYSYAGTEGKIQGESLAGRFFVRMGATRLQRDICGSAAHQGLTTTIGSSTGILPSDLFTAVSSWSGAPTPPSATSTAGTSRSRRSRRAPESWSSIPCGHAPPSRPTCTCGRFPGPTLLSPWG